MGQGEILEILERDPRRWWSAKELTLATGISRSAIHRNMMQLRKARLVRVETTLDPWKHVVYLIRHQEATA